jgi:cobalt-zinc-cadmium efflux system protein
MRSEHNHHTHDHFGKNLLWATLLNVVITIFQIIGGLLSNSLALISDAIHNLGDALAVFIAFIANKISKKDPTYSKTFGYKRVEILAALLNALILVIICAILIYESIERIQEPKEIRADIMLIVAIVGLIANLVSVFILHKDSRKNINVKAAYLHLLGDTFSSVAVIVVGIIIFYKDIIWLDPLITILISIYLFKHTFSIIKETVNILMQGTPANLDIKDIQKHVESFDEVANIHHVHLWNLTDKDIHFECHIETNSNFKLSEINVIRKKIEKALHNQFEISHFTLQFEYEACKGNSLIGK